MANLKISLTYFSLCIVIMTDLRFAIKKIRYPVDELSRKSNIKIRSMATASIGFPNDLTLHSI